MKHKWTVLFLVHAANKETRVHVNELFEKIKSTGYNEEIKVLILYGGLQVSSTEGFRIQVTLKEVVKNTSSNELNFKEVIGYGAIDIGDDKKLNKIFSEIRDRYLSDRFLLFTWDHGSGFGIFKTDPRERKLAKDIFEDSEIGNTEENYSKFVPPYQENIQFEVITNYDDNEGISSRNVVNLKGLEKRKIKTSMLTNDELRNIIKYNEGEKKVDLLIMMNCAMQMIETGYALKNDVEYLVAPETCIFWAGYNYKKIIDKLCDQPEIETETIARYAVETVKSCYEEECSMKYFDDLVISLVKPVKSLEVKEVIDEIATHLINKLPDSFVNIRSIRQNCDDLTRKYVKGVPYQYVDFLNCITKLKKTVNIIDLEKAKGAMQNYIVQIIKGNNYSTVDIENNIGQVNGCSIYYPDTSLEAHNDFYYSWFYKKNRQQTLFAADCLWKDFLLDYVKHDREKKN